MNKLDFKIHNQKSIDTMYMLSVMSIFLIGRSYTFVFAMFMIISLYNIFIYNKNFRIKPYIKEHKWISYGIAFFIYAIIISLLKNRIDLTNSMKMVLNVTFLIVSYMIYDINGVSENLKDKIIKVIEIIIIANAIQILWIYISNNLLPVILSPGGLEDSDSRYLINEYKNFIGGSNKNIWATKIGFIQIIYLYYLSECKNRLSKMNIFIVALSIVNVLLLLSRTGQITYLSALALYIVYKSLTNKNESIKKISIVCSSIGILIGVYILFDKFLNIKFDHTDGGYIRLIYWKTFFLDIWKTSFIFGNGMFYTPEFLSTYSPYYIGESNMHNIVMNIWLDFGIVGLLLYLKFIIGCFISYFNVRFNTKDVILLLIPLLIATMLQYLGYDNDIVVYMSLIYIIKNIPISKEKTK